MDIRTLSNIAKNKYLKEKVEKIIIEINNIQNCNNMEIYIQCQILLEFINACLLAQKFGVRIQQYDLIKIIEQYQKIDKNLFEELLSINCELEINQDIEKQDIEYLLHRIDYIYGYIEEKYGFII